MILFQTFLSLKKMFQREMFRLKNKIKFLLIGFLSANILSFAFICYAADTGSYVQAFYRKMNLTANDVTLKVDNLTYNGMSYIPVKTVGDLMNKDYALDNKTNTINLKDKIQKPTPLSLSYSSLYKEIIYKDMPIIRTCYDNYSKISDVNKFTDMDLKYIEHDDSFTFNSEGKRIGVASPDSLIFIQIEDEIYISWKFISEALGYTPEILSNDAILAYNNSCKPAEAKYTTIKKNNLIVTGIKYSNKTYISDTNLKTFFKVTFSSVDGNKITYTVNGKKVTIDTLKNSDCIIIGVTQYFNFSLFSNLV
jgi:hypothetical protein